MQQKRLGLRRFYLERLEDPTGISGTGIIAVGARYPDGRMVLMWVTPLLEGVSENALTIYQNEQHLCAIHCYAGTTVLYWIDEDELASDNEFDALFPANALRKVKLNGQEFPLPFPVAPTSNICAGSAKINEKGMLQTGNTFIPVQQIDMPLNISAAHTTVASTTVELPQQE